MTDFARIYGGSLYELAKEEGLDRRFLEELDVCVKVLRETPEYMRLLSTPALGREERRRAVDESFGPQLHPYLTGFMKLLVDRGEIGQFSGCVRAYRERYNQDNGILEVTATTAAPLSDAAREKLLSKLSRLFGKKILLTVKTDPAVLGGMRLECAGKRIDGTVRDRLDRLARGLRETVL